MEPFFIETMWERGVVVRAYPAAGLPTGRGAEKFGVWGDLLDFQLTARARPFILVLELQ